MLSFSMHEYLPCNLSLIPLIAIKTLTGVYPSNSKCKTSNLRASFKAKILMNLRFYIIKFVFHLIEVNKSIFQIMKYGLQ
jgi:hypothetical protein